MSFKETGVITTDFLVIGAGVAGLRAAIELSEHGEVIVVTKDSFIASSSEYAQGGVAVALENDNITSHFEDTILAGKGLCNEGAVNILVEEGPPRIQELISWGASFDMEKGQYLLAKEGGHSRNRILRSHGDSTGKEIVRALFSQINKIKNIKLLDYNFTIDLVVADNRCKGAIILNEKEKKIYGILSKAVVLASGGSGQIYSRTTNPVVATGDGMAMAFRCGAILEDMEFIQFHPTSLFIPSAPHFLITEAMRGEGAILRNINNEAFMSSYHKSAELASRDIVSRAIWTEMRKTNSKYVFLDLRHIDHDFIKKRFPNIYSTCLRFDLDITEEMIPVCPSAHFTMGGVKTDTNGATNIEGLFAAGEVACSGVHGANRLASNSLLEGLVYGSRVGIAAKEYGKENSIDNNDMNSLIDNIIEIEGSNSLSAPIAGKIRSSIRRLMWEKVGVVRTKKLLEEAIEDLRGIALILNKTFDTRMDSEIRNMNTVSLLVALSAFKREESVGAHFRSDFPESRGLKNHISIQKDISTGLKIV